MSTRKSTWLFLFLATSFIARATEPSQSKSAPSVIRADGTAPPPPPPTSNAVPTFIADGTAPPPPPPVDALQAFVAIG